MIVMIKTTNVNMDVAAENPGGKKVEGHLCNRPKRQIYTFVNKFGHVLRH